MLLLNSGLELLFYIFNLEIDYVYNIEITCKF